MWLSIVDLVAAGAGVPGMMAVVVLVRLLLVESA
jgi:hypothetical protein